jgi:hypothetical protein
MRAMGSHCIHSLCTTGSNAGRLYVVYVVARAAPSAPGVSQMVGIGLCQFSGRQCGLKWSSCANSGALPPILWRLGLLATDAQQAALRLRHLPAGSETPFGIRVGGGGLRSPALRLSGSLVGVRDMRYDARTWLTAHGAPRTAHPA